MSYLHDGMCACEINADGPTAHNNRLLRVSG
jgi:hypothetical protein